jgi:hypothetical protein
LFKEKNGADYIGFLHDFYTFFHRSRKKTLKKEIEHLDKQAQDAKLKALAANIAHIRFVKINLGFEV